MAPFAPHVSGPLKLLAVSSPFDVKDYEQGLACLAQLKPDMPWQAMFDARAYANPAPPATDALSHLAGSDEVRANFLNQALSQGGACIMVRGGFGVSRLLSKLQWPQILAAKPLVIGFSDFTALLNALAQAGLAAIHGPSLNQLSHLDADSQNEFAQLLNNQLSWPHALPGKQVVAGQATGRLVGGNLTMLCHLLGTNLAPNFNNAILALEEVNEQPYALDRLLTQLELAGVAQAVAAVALGDLHGWHEKLDPDQQQARYQVALSRISAWGKPLVVDLPFGHACRNRLLPIGATASIANSALHLGL